MNLLQILILTIFDLKTKEIDFVYLVLFQSTDKLHKHCVHAVQGFFRSIALSSGNSLQDTLR